MDELTSPKPHQIVDEQAQRIVDFLSEVGLPFDNIIASKSERTVIGNNLYELISRLPPEIKRDARYISKFVIGAGFGLFDYSLNAIWNEVVLDLRRKAEVYGLDIFFDAAVGGGKNRDLYGTFEDLSSIKDSTLLDTCRKLELISDVTYSKLKHILDMRNSIGISHPTSYSINSYELLGWLQTCVQDVLNDHPTEAALQAKAFIGNLKKQTEPLDLSTVGTNKERMSALPTHFCGNILRTIFGMFVAPETHPIVRKNISIIAPCIWKCCLDSPKFKLGIVLEGYKANLYHNKYNLGEQFFQIVGGNSYRSDSERLIILNDLVNDLKEKHESWDNFHHEAPVARALISYIPELKDIIPNIAESLFKTVLICRIGNGVSYQDGVSPGGKPHYDTLLSFAGDRYAPLVMRLLNHYEIKERLKNSTCRAQAKCALEKVRIHVINERLLECIDYLLNNIEKDCGVAMSADFKKIAAACMDYS